MINLIFEIADLDPKLYLGRWSQNWNVPDFNQIWHSEQIKHANYEYINWNWLPQLKIRNLRHLVPKLKYVSTFMKFGT